MSDRRAEIDWLATDDAPQLQQFIDTHWRKGHVLARDEELLRWQYRYPGDTDRLSVLAARADGELVGFIGVIQVSFAWRGEEVPAAWIAMWSALPDARRERVGLGLLLEALRQPYRSIACLGMNETASRIYAALRFDVRPRLPRWVRVLSAPRLERLVPGGAGWAVPALPSARAGSGSGWSEESARSWDDAWRERVAPQLVGTWRDSSYLRWRYAEHPRFKYSIRFADGAPGLFVYRLEQVAESDAQVLRIVECLGETEALVAEALAEHSDTAFADFYCTAEEFGRPLEALGFVREELLLAPVPERLQPVERIPRGLTGVFWFSPELPGAAEPLYCTKSDGDQDRPS